MIDTLIFISQRPIVVTLAILGALLVTAGSLLAKPRRSGQGVRSEADQSFLARSLTRSGYVVTFASIVLFIMAGFVSDLRP